MALLRSEIIKVIDKRIESLKVALSKCRYASSKWHELWGALNELTTLKGEI